MAFLIERRQRWSRIIGLERRGAPLDTLLGQPLPDPTKLVDEDFRDETRPPFRKKVTIKDKRPVHISGGDWITRGAHHTGTGVHLQLRRKDPQHR